MVATCIWKFIPEFLNLFEYLLGLSFECFLVLRLLDKLSDMLDAEKGLCNSKSLIQIES